MITDKRLKELINQENIYADFGRESECEITLDDEIAEALTELLTARQTIKRLKEDAEGLAQILSDGEGKEDEICCVNYFVARGAVCGHAALMKELGKK